MEVRFQVRGGFHGPYSERYIVGTILVFVGFILLFLSVVVGWYIYELKYTDDGRYEWKLYLTKERFEASSEEMKDSERRDWDDSENEAIADVCGVAKWTIIFSLIITIVAIILILLIGSLSQSPMSLNTVQVILTVVAVSFALIAPLYFMVALPGGFEDDTDPDFKDEGPWDSFWGHNYDSEEHRKDKWHPSWGWFFAMVGGVLILSGGTVVYGAGKLDEKKRRSLQKAQTSFPVQPIPQQLQESVLLPLAQGSRTCPRCQSQVFNNASFCPFCGFRL